MVNKNLPNNSVSNIVKPRTMSTINQSITGQARPTSPKITKRINSSSLVQPSNFGQSRLNNNRINSTNSANNNQQKPLIKKPTSTLNATKSLTINNSSNRLNGQQSSVNRLNIQQSSSKLQNSRTSSTTSVKSREPSKKQLVKDTISNSAFVPKEKLEKLTKKHEELTNKYNLSSQVVNKNQIAIGALSCLINYMAVDLNAFECPNLKKRINYLETIEQDLKVTVSNLNAENERVNSELKFERNRHQEEKENLLGMFEVEIKRAEKTYQDNIKVERAKRDEAEKSLLYLKQSLSRDKKIDFLNKEIESLKTVLELKDNEIKDLRYKLDRTFVDKDEISQLRNERDNLSLAKEQLEYSLNMKNEELKFVLQENTSLASLNSLTSTPLNNDRNNNLVKKRKMNSQMKKQKLDSNDDDDDNFIKPLNLHKERFVKPTPDKEYFNKPFDDDLISKSLDDNNFVKPLTNEDNFKKPFIDDNVESNDENFEEHNSDEDYAKPMSLDHNQVNLNDDNEYDFQKNFQEDFKKSFNVQKSEDVQDHFIRPNSIERNNLNDSFNDKRKLSTSSDKQINSSMDRSFHRSSFHRSSNRSSNHNFDNSSNNSFNNYRSSFNKSLNISECNSESNSAKNNLRNSQSKPFDINEIKERCFTKPIDKKESPVKNVDTVKTDNKVDGFKLENVYLQQENFIKTCKILDDNEMIGIIKSKKPESVLDSGFGEC